MGKMKSVSCEKLKLARDMYGLTLDEVCQSTKISVQSLEKFEVGSDSPTYSQLQKLSEYYRKSFLYFFMQKPIEFDSGIAAFRSAERFSRVNLSKRMLDMIEQAEIYKLNLKELNSDTTKTSFQELLLDNDINDSSFIPWLRRVLDLDLEKQKQQFSKTEKLIEYVREKFYEIGIFIFKDSFQDNAVSGLCLYDDQYPIILVNNKTTFNRQLFTIFHEVFHVYRKEADIDFSKDDEERSCDSFASEFLIPSDDFDEQMLQYDSFENHNVIGSLAKLYKVSEDAVMYRLLKKGKISRRFYQENRVPAIRQSDEVGGGGNFYFTRMSYLGKPYISNVLDSYYKGRIQITDVAKYTQLKSINVKNLISNVLGGGFL